MNLNRTTGRSQIVPSEGSHETLHAANLLVGGSSLQPNDATHQFGELGKYSVRLHDEKAGDQRPAGSWSSNDGHSGEDAVSFVMHVRECGKRAADTWLKKNVHPLLPIQTAQQTEPTLAPAPTPAPAPSEEEE